MGNSTLQQLFVLTCLVFVNAFSEWPVMVFQEGETAHLPCPPQGEANAFFWRKGEWFNNSDHIASIVHGIGDNSDKYNVLPDGALEIMDLSYDDEGKYFCRIASDSNECHGSITVYLEVSLEALDIAIEECEPSASCTKVVKPSHQYQLTCTANKVSELMTLKWYNGSNEISRDANATDRSKTGKNNKMISVISFIFEDDSELSCEADGVNIPRNVAVVQLTKKEVLSSDEEDENSMVLIIPIVVLGILCLILTCILVSVAVKYIGTNKKRKNKSEISMETASKNEAEQKEKEPFLKLQKQVEEKDNVVKNLQEQVEQNVNEVEKLQKQAEKKDNDMEKLRKQVEQKDNEMKKLQKQVEQKDSEVKKLKQEKDGKQRPVEFTPKTKEVKQSQGTEQKHLKTESTNLKLQEDIKKKEDEVKKLQEDIKEKDDEVKTLKRKLVEANKGKSAIEREKEKLESTLHIKEQRIEELQNVKRDLTKLESTLHIKEQQIEELQNVKRNLMSFTKITEWRQNAGRNSSQGSPRFIFKIISPNYEIKNDSPCKSLEMRYPNVSLDSAPTFQSETITELKSSVKNAVNGAVSCIVTFGKPESGIAKTMESENPDGGVISCIINHLSELVDELQAQNIKVTCTLNVVRIAKVTGKVSDFTFESPRSKDDGQEVLRLINGLNITMKKYCVKPQERTTQILIQDVCQSGKQPYAFRFTIDSFVGPMHLPTGFLTVACINSIEEMRKFSQNPIGNDLASFLATITIGKHKKVTYIGSCDPRTPGEPMQTLKVCDEVIKAFTKNKRNTETK